MSCGLGSEIWPKKLRVEFSPPCDPNRDPNLDIAGGERLFSVCLVSGQSAEVRGDLFSILRFWI